MSQSIAAVALEHRVDALFSRYTKPGSPGAVVAVMRGNTVEVCKGYGLASIELGVPIGPATRFRIASVSKQFTVTAALMLAAEGKLKLADPPHKYLPELAPLPAAEIDAVTPNLATGYLGDEASGFRRAAHAYPQGGEGGLTSSVEDLLIWSRHFDHPTLGKTLPAQLKAVAPLTGGHANGYRRGVAIGEVRGLETVGHGGLWPGYRTEFLRVPA